MLVFDITRRETFENLSKVVRRIERVKDCSLLKVPIVIVGNRLDEKERRKVSTEEARDWAYSFGAGYIETSALKVIAVEEAFVMMIRRIRYQRWVIHPKN